jgi:hypothetical protein
MRFCEDPHNRLGPRRPDEHTAFVSELSVQACDLGTQGGGKLLCANGDVLLRLRVLGHDGGSLGEGAAFERAAQEQRRREAVAGDVVAQDDDVAGLGAVPRGRSGRRHPS